MLEKINFKYYSTFRRLVDFVEPNNFYTMLFKEEGGECTHTFGMYDYIMMRISLNMFFKSSSFSS